MEILKVESLSFVYPENKKYSLKDINFTVNKGDFILICGQSGCGKSTLLRHLKADLSPAGKRSGNVYYRGHDIYTIDDRSNAKNIGYVLQNPDSQIVTEKVYHEIAFGLENLGYDSNVIRRRVAEMASFFGIQGWFRKDVSQLSGGQKQLLNLAAIMVMEPEILILDEPTAQLDPIAARDFINMVLRINNELSTTVIMAEHNLEEIYSLVDKVIVMEEGKVISQGMTKEVSSFLKDKHMGEALPTTCRIFNKVKDDYICGDDSPLSIKDGMLWIDKYFEKVNCISCDEELDHHKLSHTEDDDLDENFVVEMRDVCFSYKRGDTDVLKNMCLSVKKGEIYSILGGNGTGKTTALGVIARINNLYRGKVLINGRDIKKYKSEELYNCNLSYLVQNPLSMFVHDTLREDLEETNRICIKKGYGDKSKLDCLIDMMNLRELLDTHPYDLSGGEIQKSALAKILLLNPKILLLDEPTKGLDSFFKKEMGQILSSLKAQGTTIIMVTHDIEFCAKYSDRCGLFFDGYIVSEDKTKDFFIKNSFYTTAANRICRNASDNILTCEEAVELCKQRMKKRVI